MHIGNTLILSQGFAVAVAWERFNGLCFLNQCPLAPRSNPHTHIGSLLPHGGLACQPRCVGPWMPVCGGVQSPGLVPPRGCRWPGEGCRYPGEGRGVGTQGREEWWVVTEWHACTVDGGKKRGVQLMAGRCPRPRWCQTASSAPPRSCWQVVCDHTRRDGQNTSPNLRLSSCSLPRHLVGYQRLAGSECACAAHTLRTKPFPFHASVLASTSARERGGGLWTQFSFQRLFFLSWCSSVGAQPLTTVLTGTARPCLWQ